jgi:hypothetical protein
MIAKDLAKKQIARLGGMFGFPIGMREAIEELVLAVQCAETEAIAARAISGFIDTADSDTRCPMPRQIREAINAIQEPVWEPEKAPEVICLDCGDSGIVGGLVGGPPATWCFCSASRRAKLANPNALVEINQSREKLAAAFGRKVTPKELLARAANERRALANVTEILGTIDASRQGRQ